MFKPLLSLAVLVPAALIHLTALAQPIARNGSCPSGYYASGNYCLPSNGARPAMHRNGSCPSGYYASGNYCVASSGSSKNAIPRNGSCPSGYYASGNYCVSSR
ncbi:MAG: hypothetical protein RL087_858 [Pseudomonadota bacterium]